LDVGKATLLTSTSTKFTNPTISANYLTSTLWACLNPTYRDIRPMACRDLQRDSREGVRFGQYKWLYISMILATNWVTIYMYMRHKGGSNAAKRNHRYLRLISIRDSNLTEIERDSSEPTNYELIPGSRPVQSRRLSEYWGFDSY